MSISDKLAAFESGDYDLNDTISLDSSPFCSLSIDQGHKSLSCCQIAGLIKFVRTGDKHFFD